MSPLGDLCHPSAVPPRWRRIDLGAFLPAGLLEALVGHGELVGARSLTSGGSPARIWATQFSDAEPLVVKYLDHGPRMVDGHDVEAFRAKILQLRTISRDESTLAADFVSIRYSWEGAGWTAFAMPELAGSPIVSMTDESVPAFEDAVVTVFERLGADGYARVRRPTPAGWSRRAHVDRISRRLGVLARAVPRELLVSDRVRVAGVEVAGLRVQLERLSRLLSEPATRFLLEPPALHYPLHGDLNLGNVIWDPRARHGTLIDPRGIHSAWDFAYDVAKGLFTLAFHHDALVGGIEVDCQTHSGWTVELPSSTPRRQTATRRFVDTLERVPFVRDLTRHDPHFRTRVALNNACHHLAEAACRLSDRKNRHLETGGEVPVETLATGYVVEGLRQLDRFLEQLSRPRDVLETAQSHRQEES